MLVRMRKELSPQTVLIFSHFNLKNISDFQALCKLHHIFHHGLLTRIQVVYYRVIAFQMAGQNGKSKQSTPRRGTSEWVGFPSSSFLNPIGSSPFNFTNPLSKHVLLIADPKYVNKHTCAYLDTTLHVSGFKVTKFSSLCSSPLFWTKTRSECKSEAVHSSDSSDVQHTEAFWEYILNLSDFDCILIPSQMYGDIFDDLTDETKLKLKEYVHGGGCLICCHFRATALLNWICGVSWHEISVQIGASYHVAKEQVLEYKNDVRGVVNMKRENVIYKTCDDFVTVARRAHGNGCCYYIGHDFAFLWGKNWNRILFMAIKQTLTNSAENVINLNFNAIDVEAFKNLNIESNGTANGKDIYLEEFQPDFPAIEPTENGTAITMETDDGFDEFDAFDGLNGFGDDIQDNEPQENQENVNPEDIAKKTKEFESIGYIQMDDDGVVTMEDRGSHLDRIDEDIASNDSGRDTDNGSLEEVD